MGIHSCLEAFTTSRLMLNQVVDVVLVHLAYLRADTSNLLIHFAPGVRKVLIHLQPHFRNLFVHLQFNGYVLERVRGVRRLCPSRWNVACIASPNQETANQKPPLLRLYELDC